MDYEEIDPKDRNDYFRKKLNLNKYLKVREKVEKKLSRVHGFKNMYRFVHDKCFLLNIWEEDNNILFKTLWKLSKDRKGEFAVSFIIEMDWDTEEFEISRATLYVREEEDDDIISEICLFDPYTLEMGEWLYDEINSDDVLPGALDGY